MAKNTNVFRYFAYGSNLLAERIHANSPSAVRLCIGKLENYKLGFGYFSERWNGYVATIIPDPGNHIYGAVWEIDNSDLPNLDRQEGVQAGIYEPISVDVETSTNEKISCRCYELCVNKDAGYPSLLYLTIILDGAIESNLPAEYIDQLRKIKHNGWNEMDRNEIRKRMLE